MTDRQPANYRVSDLAARWRCSPGKVRSMIAAGELPCLRLGKLIRIPAAAVVAYEARSLTTQSTGHTPKPP